MWAQGKGLVGGRGREDLGEGWVGSGRAMAMGGGGLKQQKFGRQKQIGGSGTPSGLPRGLKTCYLFHVLLSPLT